MKNIEKIQKLSVLHCVYQMIASADGSIEEERDEAAISLALSEVDLAAYSWHSALQLNPHDCFIHLHSLNDCDKEKFRVLLMRIAQMGGHEEFRISCANHLFQLCGM